MATSITAADLFCGAGGTSSGLARACNKLGIGLDLLAINHWDIAIKTHSLNHPKAKHLCENLDAVDPRKLINGRLNLLVASPECTHHSVARGGKPINDQSRASAWHVIRWAEALLPDNILVENVKEFQTWGPLGSNGRPLKSRQGETFQAFVTALKSLGYTVDYQVLNAANYGDATTRQRLFVQARRGRRKISWPEATHTPDGASTLFGDTKKWTAAKDIIDWKLKSESIFARKKMLAPSTLKRIEAGLRKFGGKAAEPFIVVLRNHGDAKSINDPLPTITAGGQHVGLCEPFLIGVGGPQGSAKPKSINQPLSTVLTESHMGVVEPFLVTVNHGDEGPNSRARRSHSVNGPIPTLTTNPSLGVVEPFIVQVNHTGSDETRCQKLDKPLPVVTTKNGYGVVEPVVLTEEQLHELEEKSPESFLLHLNRNNDNPTPVSEPMQTITATSSDFGLVEPFLVKFYGSGTAVSVDDPLDTITAKDRFGLVEIGGEKYYLDIRFRMLQPHELARAMSFGDSYKFAGNRASMVKQIGNAVPCGLAQALITEILMTDAAIMQKAA